MNTKTSIMQLAKAIAEILNNSNYEAYIVGGTVRDLMLFRPPKDLDMATNAKPEAVGEIFRKVGANVIETGIKHGTVTVIMDSQAPVEITTYRVDGKYSDGRHPDSVEYVSSLYDDLARRDFTINAMAINPVTEVIEDPFDGMGDINKAVIHAVGNPQERFNEDGLRALRAARFAGQLGYMVHGETFEAMTTPETKATLALVSRERVRDEILKGLGGKFPTIFVTMLAGSGLLYEILPEVKAMKGLPQPEKYHKHDVLTHSFMAMTKMSDLTEDPFLRLMALLHDIGKNPDTLTFGDDGRPHYYKHDLIGSEIIGKVMSRLKMTSEQIDKAKRLVANHLMFYNDNWTDAQIRRWVNRVGVDLVDAQISLAIADLIAHDKPERILAASAYINLNHRLSIIRNPGMTVRDLAINGHDLMALGYKGRSIGAIQKRLLDAVIEDPSINTREILLDIASLKGRI